ncbi:Ring finger domain family protein [Brugia pahangi]
MIVWFYFIKPTVMFNNLICFICNGRIIMEQISVLHSCGHAFHYQCILHWIRVFKKCPICFKPKNECNIVKQLYFVTDEEDQQEERSNYSPLPRKKIKGNLDDLRSDNALFRKQGAEAIKIINEIRKLKEQKISKISKYYKRNTS